MIAGGIGRFWPRPEIVAFRNHPFQRKHAAILAINHGENPEPGRRCINEEKGVN